MLHQRLHLSTVLSQWDRNSHSTMPLFVPFSTMDLAVTAFRQSTLSHYSILLALKPLSVLLLFKDHDSGILVWTGQDTPPALLTPQHNLVMFQFSQVDSNLVRIALQSCVVLGAAMLAHSRPEASVVLATLLQWSASLRGFQSVHQATEQQLFYLKEAGGDVSKLAAAACHDKAVNRDICRLMGLVPSGFASASSYSADFCLGGALAMRPRSLPEDFWNPSYPIGTIRMSVYCGSNNDPYADDADVDTEDDNLPPHFDTENVSVLRVKQLASQKKQVNVLVKFQQGGAIMLPVHRDYTLQATLQEIRNAHRALAQQWPQLSPEQQKLVPLHSGLFGAADLLEDNYVTVNGSPLYSAGASLEVRASHAIRRALQSSDNQQQMPSSLFNIIDSYYMVQQGTCMPGAVDVSAQHYAELQLTLDNVLALPVAPTASMSPQLYPHASRFGAHLVLLITITPFNCPANDVEAVTHAACMLQFVDKSMPYNISTVVRGYQFEADLRKLLPSLGRMRHQPDLRYIQEQRHQRATVQFTLRMGRALFKWTHAGTLYCLIQEGLSVPQLTAVLLGFVMHDLVHYRGKAPESCVDMRAYTIYQENPLDHEKRATYEHMAGFAPLRVQRGCTIEIDIQAAKLKFSLPPNSSQLDAVRYELAKDITDNALMASTFSSKRQKYPCMMFCDNLLRLCTSVLDLLPALTQDIADQLRAFDATALPGDPLPHLSLASSSVHILSLQAEVECPPWLTRLVELNAKTAEKLCGRFRLSTLYWFDCPGTSLLDDPLSPLPCLHPLPGMPPLLRPPCVASVWCCPVDKESFGSSYFRFAGHLRVKLQVKYNFPKNLFLVDGEPIEPTTTGEHSSHLEEEDSDEFVSAFQVLDKTVLQKAAQRFHAHADSAVAGAKIFADLNAAILDIDGDRDDDQRFLVLPPFYPVPANGSSSMIEQIDVNCCIRATITPDPVALGALLNTLRCEEVSWSALPSINLYEVLPDELPVYDQFANTTPSLLSDIYRNLPHCIGTVRSLKSTVRTVVAISLRCVTLPLLDLAIFLKLKECGCLLCKDLSLYRLWTVNDALTKGKLTRAMGAAQNSLRQRIFFVQGATPSFSHCPDPVTRYGMVDGTELGKHLLAETLECLPEEGAEYLMTNLFFHPGDAAFPLICAFLQLNLNVDDSRVLKANEYFFEGMHFITPTKKRALEHAF